MNSELLEEIFMKANEMFIEKEIELITKDVSERSWYSPMSRYLDDELRRHNVSYMYVVDTEYNRNGNEIKQIYDSETGNVESIVCDIIIHSRGNNKYQDNLLCIEMKKSNRREVDKEKDKSRLKLLTKKSFDNEWNPDGISLPQYVCGYILGIYYEIDIEKRMIHIELYKDGKMFNEDSFSL